jgi:predicted dehydrogenase
MRVIQVGIGGMGNVWLKAVQSSTEVEYAGFVEVNEAIAKEQAERYRLDPALIFRSLEEALATVSADGVIDITPPQFHQTISMTALEAGIPVLSEKPLANTLEAAQAIVDKANKTRVLHVVSQNYRYRQPIQTLKRVLDSGELGQAGAVTVNFFKGPHFGGFREEMAYPLIIDMAIHHFDLMRFFLESDPVVIFGQSWNPVWSWFKGDASANVLLEFANKVRVAYNSSWCSTGRGTSWNASWRIECEKGVVTLEDDKVYRQLTGQEVVLIEPVGMKLQDQAYMLHEFYEAVTNGKTLTTTCQDNIKSLAIVFDTVKSFETGKVIQFSH